MRPGIMSTLPPRLGTQKLWMTSAERQREFDVAADRNADLVGAGDRRAVEARHRRRATTIARRSPRSTASGSSAGDALPTASAHSS